VSEGPAAAPTVSVVLPTYDRERIVGRAIDSVLGQTFADLELLLVDDGSGDGTAGMVKARYGREPRLHYLPKANGGTATARNHGLERARGRYVAFLDSDDVWLPGFLASQVALLEAHPDAALSVCDARFDGAWEGRGPTMFRDRDFRPPTSMDAMMQGAWAVPSAWCLRRAAADGLRFAVQYRFCEDTEFLFQLAARRLRVVLNSELLAVYMRHGGEGGAVQKTDLRPEHELHHLRMLGDYAAFVADPAALRRRVLDRSRALARALVAAGRWREARPLLWFWLRRRPDSSTAWRYWLRSLLAGG
jgi:glycosyltransferase involved in cell wall biosynthesis